jgi:hypothetical protein
MKMLFLLLLPSIIHCDEPVHCLRHQVSGEWNLYLSAWKDSAFPDCSDHSKDNAAHTITAHLADPDSSKFSKAPWTMVSY